jgi:hypothetical protein
LIERGPADEKVAARQRKRSAKSRAKEARQSWRGELNKFFKALVLAWGFIIIIIIIISRPYSVPFG